MRNLFKIWSKKTVVAFVTAGNEAAALKRYAESGGKALEPTAERLTFGYPADECVIYA